MQWLVKKYNKFIRLFNNIYSECEIAEISLLATSLAFSTVFALAPVFALFISIAVLSDNVISIPQYLLDDALNYLLAGTGDELIQRLKELMQGVDPVKFGLVGLFGLLFTTTKMIYDLDMAIVRIWKAQRDRIFWQRALIYTGIVLLAPLCLSVAASILDWNIFSNEFLSTRTSIVLLCLFIAFKFTPPTKIRPLAALYGTLFTGVILYLGKEVYVWTTMNIFNYSKTFGSLAFIPLFLFWLFVIWYIVLSGFVFVRLTNLVLNKRLKNKTVPE